MRLVSLFKKSQIGFFEVVSGYSYLSSSGLGADALLVELDFVLDAVVQLEVVVLQRGGGA